ncbi:MAG: hypothetical protein EPO28_10425, partial [Saprospiraceae bacterium]
MKRNLLTLLSLLFFINLQAQEKAPDRLTPEKLWQFGRVSLFDVSPDGAMAVYGVSHYDLAANKGNSDLYAISTDGSTNGLAIQL